MKVPTLLACLIALFVCSCSEDDETRFYEIAEIEAWSFPTSVDEECHLFTTQEEAARLYEMLPESDVLKGINYEEYSVVAIVASIQDIYKVRNVEVKGNEIIISYTCEPWSLIPESRGMTLIAVHPKQQKTAKISLVKVGE